MSDNPPGHAIYRTSTEHVADVKPMPWPGMTPTASRIADHIHAETVAHGGIPPEKYELARSTFDRLTDEMKPLMNPGHVVICGVMVVPANA